MANMSYCRFENTVPDLKDCLDNMDKPLDDNQTEIDSRKRLIEMACEIAENYGFEIGIRLERVDLSRNHG